MSLHCEVRPCSSASFSRSNIDQLAEPSVKEHKQSLTSLVRWLIPMPVCRYNLSAWFNFYWYSARLNLSFPIYKFCCIPTDFIFSEAIFFAVCF